MTRRRPRVGILFNFPTLPKDDPNYASEAGVVDVARAVSSALKLQGFRPFAIPARPPAQRLVRSLVKKRPDVVFNLIEGFAGDSAGEAHVTSLLELLGVPYTGCPPEAQGLCRSKSRTKRLLKGAGLPTAPFQVLEPGDSTACLIWTGPVVVKPDSEDASLGIDQGSVIVEPDGLGPKIDRIRASHGPRVLIESYLPGPEFNVGILALPRPEPLPVAEIVYRPTAGRWPILTHAAKWDVGSVEDLESRPRCPAEIDVPLAEHLQALAIEAFQVCGCRDYARVDFRLDGDGTPMILEVNPNPDLDPNAGLARAMVAGGRDWPTTIAQMVNQALDRKAET